MSDVTNDSTIELDKTRSAAAATTQSLSSIAVGDVLRGRYVLLERLGQGGKGAVFKALDRFRGELPEAQQYVTLKILSVGGGDSAQALANSGLELHCAQALSHRNIVNVYDLDRHADVIFFTMEFLDGEALSDIIKRLRPAPMRRAQAWQLIQQLCAGLAHAHERGIVHGDLKPRNIFVTRQGELRILDFGSAHSFASPVLRTEHAEHAPTSGTPAYASCEQLEGRTADPRDDLYALACICYELLTGSHPFGLRPATLARDYRVELVRPLGLTTRQWRALQKGLSWHRAGRSIAVRAWKERLIKDSLPESAVTPLVDIAQTDRARSKLPWRAAAAFLVVGLTTAGVLAQLRSNAAPEALAPSAATPPVAVSPEASSSPTADAQPMAESAMIPVVDSEKKDVADSAQPPKPTAKAASLAISVEPSQVRSDDHFAEIRLHRNLLQKNSSFTWWTEPATAKPDVDYVPESVAVQTFPDGFHSARLYVRLMPQALRSQRSFFYIAIAQSGPHQSQPNVIRRQVWLPPSSSLQAQR